MSSSPGATDSPSTSTQRLRGRRALLQRQPWLIFVLPLAVYMIVGAVEPKKSPPSKNEAAAEVAPEPADQPDAEEATPDGAAAKPDDAKPEETKPGPKPAAKPDEAADAGQPADGGAAKSDEEGAESDEAVAPSRGPRPPKRPAGLLGIPYSYYPLVYTIKIALTLLAVWFVLPGYRQFPFRVSPLAVLVGAAGIIVWIGLCDLRLEQRWLVPFGMEWFVGAGARSGFDPSWMFLDQPSWQLWGFLAVRLFGLVVVVAVIEEFFLRGFLMRFVASNDWPSLPIGAASVSAFVACVVYAVLSHPAEMFAATVWFLLISLLAVKTKNIWDCVVAHATTNLLLGIYILVFDQFQYW